MTCDPWNSHMKQLRARRRLTLTKIHELTQIPIAQLSKIENRTKPPTYVQAVKLAQIFGCDPDDLFCGTSGLARTIRGGGGVNHLPFILHGYNRKKAWYLNRRDQQFARRIEQRAAEHLANLRTSNQACSAIEAESDHRGSLALPSRGQPSDKSPTQ